MPTWGLILPKYENFAIFDFFYLRNYPPSHFMYIAFIFIFPDRTHVQSIVINALIPDTTSCLLYLVMTLCAMRPVFGISLTNVV